MFYLTHSSNVSVFVIIALHILLCAATADSHIAHQRPRRKTASHFHISGICHNKQGPAGCEQRTRGSTVAHQQASAVPEPPAAILSG